MSRLNIVISVDLYSLKVYMPKSGILVGGSTKLEMHQLYGMCLIIGWIGGLICLVLIQKAGKLAMKTYNAKGCLLLKIKFILNLRKRRNAI